jgi:hypothetical protein
LVVLVEDDDKFFVPRGWQVVSVTALLGSALGVPFSIAASLLASPTEGCPPAPIPLLSIAQKGARSVAMPGAMTSSSSAA